MEPFILALVMEPSTSPAPPAPAQPSPTPEADPLANNAGKIFLTLYFSMLLVCSPLILLGLVLLGVILSGWSPF